MDMSLAELRAWISANFWKAEQVTGWVQAQFYRKAIHRQTSDGSVHANLPIVLDVDGNVDASMLDGEDIADVVGAMVTGNTETGITVTYDDADNTLDFVVDTEFIADTVGAMVTSNTETGITVTYDDTDNTLDFVVDTEYIADTVGAMVTGNTETGVTVTYQDADNTLDFALDDEYLQDTVGAMVASNTETGIAVTYNDTTGKLDFDAQTAGDARYAPIAKGVTNGDSHDHSGGDGAQINHTTLSNIGTNTHAQIDTALATAVTNDATAASHIAATAAHGATGAVVGTTNTQTLTNKTFGDVLNADAGLTVDGGTIEFDPGSGADATRAFNFNIASNNYAKLLVPSGSGGALSFWVGTAGAAAERVRITSAGILRVYNIIRAMSASGIRLEDDAGNLGLFVEDGGDVGVGTASPATKLHVVDGSVRIGRDSSAGANYLELAETQGGGRIGKLDIYSNTLRLGELGVSDVLAVDLVNQRVGIETNSPSTTLDVNGTITATGINLGEDTMTIYDEGTWTPALSFAGGTTGITYNSRVGTYTRINNRVWASCRVELTSKGSSTGVAEISLPIAASSSSMRSPATITWTSMTTAMVNMQAVVLPSNAIAQVFGATAATTGIATVSNADFANNSIIQFEISYLV